MKKLELKAIACYLPYGLNCQWSDGEITKINPSLDDIDYESNEIPISLMIFSINRSSLKPILRPLSDLYKPCLEGGKIPIVELAKISTGIDWDKYEASITDVNETTIEISSRQLIFSFSDGSFYLQSKGLKELRKTTCLLNNQLALFQYLYEHHFDVFGLIDQSLAIDINTVK